MLNCDLTYYFLKCLELVYSSYLEVFYSVLMKEKPPSRICLQQQADHPLSDLNRLQSNDQSVISFKNQSGRINNDQELENKADYSKRGSKKGQETVILIQVQKLKTDQSNTHKAKVTDTDLNARKKKPRECRICLEDDSEGRIIRPCRCTGSMEFAHEKCLSEWIKRKMDIRSKEHFHCQVCDEPFEYKLSKQLSLSMEELKKNFTVHRSTFYYFGLLMSLLLLVWIGLLVLVILGSVQEDGKGVRETFMPEQHTRVVFVCVVLIFLGILGVVNLLFLAEYGVKSEITIKNILNWGEKSVRKRQHRQLYNIAT